MRSDDLEALTRLAPGEQEQQWLRHIANELAQHTSRGSISAHWWLPLRFVSALEAD